MNISFLLKIEPLEWECPENDNEVKLTVWHCDKDVERQFFKEGILIFIFRYEKCFERNGDYFENSWIYVYK